MADSTQLRPTIYVRKYPNRRLYNLASSGYVTQEDVLDLVRTGYPVVIQERATNGKGQKIDVGDVTDYILLQAIRESEPLLAALLRRVDLKALIRDTPNE